MSEKPFEFCPVCKQKVPRGHRLHLHFSAKNGAVCNCPKVPWHEDIKKHYPEWYSGPPNPHVSIVNLGDGRWRCSDCGQEGSVEEMMMRPGCTFDHKPCKHCGCAPVCASDCSGIGAILNDPDVYVAGFHDNGEH